MCLFLFLCYSCQMCFGLPCDSSINTPENEMFEVWWGSKERWWIYKEDLGGGDQPFWNIRADISRSRLALSGEYYSSKQSSRQHICLWLRKGATLFFVFIILIVQFSSIRCVNLSKISQERELKTSQFSFLIFLLSYNGYSIFTDSLYFWCMDRIVSWDTEFCDCFTGTKQGKVRKILSHGRYAIGGTLHRHTSHT